MFKDNYNREISYLRISVTDKCNLRCTYCMPAEGVKLLNHSEILRIEEILKIVEIFVKNGVNKIRITGGEPLVRKGITDLIKGIRSLMPEGDLAMTTNGTLLKRFGEELYNAGLDRLNISIDSLNRDTYKSITRRDMINDVLDGIETVKNIPFKKIKINVVVIKDKNSNEIIDFVNLTEKYPWELRFIEYMPFNNEENWREKHLFPASEILKIIKNNFKIVKTDDSETATKYKVKGFSGTIGLISPMTEHFCEKCNRMRLTANGYLRPCLFSEKMVNIKEPLRSGVSDSELEKIIKESVNFKPIINPMLDDKEKKPHTPMSYLGG